jgi:hypothetical protein
MPEITDSNPQKAGPASSSKAGAAKKRPSIEIHTPERERLSPTPLVAGIVLVVVGTAFAVFSERNTPDPHLVRAREVVARYEQGKPTEAIDYESRAYADALGELALVERNSKSAPEADELAAEIRRKIAEQQARVRARNAEMQARQERQQQRDEEFFRVQRMEPPHDPKAPVPGCDEGGRGKGSGENGGHQH